MVKKRTTKTVVVAVIDSGVDIEHEDLQGRIWTNTDEIADNGIDDDNNGYIDDVHGWNFLGGPTGDNANDIRLEMTRIYASLVDKYGGDVELSTDEEKAEYALFVEVKELVEGKRMEAEQTMAYLEQIINNVDDDTKAQIKNYMEYLEGQLNVHYNPDLDGRAVIGDNPDDFSDRSYGNGDVEGPDAFHGTHVSGIIGAVRGNELGGDGVANDVRIMSVRAVPNGDEFDKDIALAVRYAVDNGAQVINMSFGKAYSPHAEEVAAAFAYADSKGVLLVHAAGNDHKNIDEESNFPSPKYDFQEAKLDHWLEIGASTRFSKEVKAIDLSKAGDDKAKLAKLQAKNRFAGNDLAASFSNYSPYSVDVFAPGLEIYNTVPDNKYQAIQGTSMACPMVAGAAAMIKSYFPEMSMKDIKTVLLETATVYTGEAHVKPGGVAGEYGVSSDLVDFSSLSITGGVINLKNAVKRCLEIEKGN